MNQVENDDFTFNSNSLEISISDSKEESTEEDKEENIDNNNDYITIEEVAKHDLDNDCWVIVDDKVYDLTPLFGGHGGGNSPLSENCGTDATDEFLAQSAHSGLNILDKFYQGDIGTDTPTEENTNTKPTIDLFEQFSVVQEFCPKPIVCFSNDSDSKVIEKSVKAGVAAYIVDGKSEERIKPIIDVAILRFNQCQAVKKELAQVKDKLSERAVIEKAKGLLVEHKNMTENDAYKTLRKMAMNQGKKISVVAHEVCGVLIGLGEL